MKAILLFLILCAYTSTVAAQPSDVLLLKKKNRIVQLYTKATQISFYTKRGVFKNAQIKLIKNDTVFLREYLIQRIPTTLGFFIIDTLGSFSYAYHYNDIYKMSKEQRNFNVSGSGSSLFCGGLLLTLGNTVVLLADRKSFSLPFMLGSIAATSIGYYLLKKVQKGIIIGKNKYHFEYLKMATPK